jgi:hypothetical protein
MNLLVLLLILWEIHTHETTKDVGKIEQTIVLENRVEDAQKKCLWGPDAGWHTPVMRGQNALLPPSNCLEIQAH